MDNFLKKKIGPLAAWQWGLIAGGGYMIYTKFIGGSASSAGTDQGTYTDQYGNVYDADGNLISGTNVTGQTAGDYYDAYGNLYDANGNLIQPAPTNAPVGVPASVDTSSSGYDQSQVDQAVIDAESAAQAAYAAAGTIGAGGYTGSAVQTPSNNSQVSPGVVKGSNSNIVSVQKLASGASLETLASGRQIETTVAGNRYVTKAGAGSSGAPHTVPTPASIATGAHALSTRLASGAILTIHPSGAVTEQAPGKSAYVVTSATAARKKATPKKTGI